VNNPGVGQSSAATVWRKDVMGWSLYDFANTIYSMNVVSLYLKRYIVEDLGHDDRYFDIPFSISMFLAALMLPALGAMSDHSTKKKMFLFLFTLSCCLAVGLLPLVPPGAIFLTLLLFVFANFSYEAGQPFYNSLLYSVADGVQARFVSGVGVALGYVGAILGMILVLPFVSGNLFGWNVGFMEGSGKVGAFLPSAILFLLFALPLFLWVRESPVSRPKRTSFFAAYRDVWEGLRQTSKYPGVLRYLIADYFFEDAVTTVILNIGIYCSLVVGFDDDQISIFLIISTITAVLGAFAIGWLARIWSLRKLLTIIIWGWVITLLVFVLTDSRTVIWVLGSLVGILLGGLWTTTRPLLAELVPRDELGRFFGLFSLSGRAAAVVGPLIWTSVVYLFQPDRPLGNMAANLLGADAAGGRLAYKMAVVSLVVMMIIGLIIFRKVPHTRSAIDG